MLTLLDYPNLSVTMAGWWSMSPGAGNSVSNSENTLIKWQQQVTVLNSAYKYVFFSFLSFNTEKQLLIVLQHKMHDALTHCFFILYYISLSLSTYMCVYTVYVYVINLLSFKV